MTRITVVIEDHAEGIHLGQQLAGGRVVRVEQGDHSVPLEELEELVTDMVIAQGSMRNAAKHDPRWEGCADAIQPRIDSARAAIAKAHGN